jgi:hypothetical protein
MEVTTRPWLLKKFHFFGMSNTHLFPWSQTPGSHSLAENSTVVAIKGIDMSIIGKYLCPRIRES